MEESIQSEVHCQEQMSENENTIPPEDPSNNNEDENVTVEKVDLDGIMSNEKLTDESPVPENESVIATPKV